MAASGQNTNLGIILLCAPLAAAAESRGTALRPALAAVLDGLGRDDAGDVFAAIVRANPGGLGRSETHDVRAPATATLKEAMAEAAERDRIARQYVTAYEDIFSLGLPALDAARGRGRGRRWSTLAVYLAFLASLPDTHILRKFDAAAAVETQRVAERWRKALETADDPDSMVAELLRWDAELKSRGINPGTSADLTVATLFAAALASIGSAHLDLTR
jgi:triphosphoribosyl-dephospho-CoA synthase